jgi:hypothetical protein
MELRVPTGFQIHRSIRKRAQPYFKSPREFNNGFAVIPLILTIKALVDELVYKCPKIR